MYDRLFSLFLLSPRYSLLFRQSADVPHKNLLSVVQQLGRLRYVSTAHELNAVIYVVAFSFIAYSIIHRFLYSFTCRVNRWLLSFAFHSLYSLLLLNASSLLVSSRLFANFFLCCSSTLNRRSSVCPVSDTLLLLSLFQN